MPQPLLYERLLTTIEKNPSKIAVTDGISQITYGELGGVISRLGTFLSENIKAGDRVVILLDNSIEYIASCYGIWAAGGVVVGLNTALKSDDLRRLILHCGANVVISSTKHRELHRALDGKIKLDKLILVDDDSPLNSAVSWSQIMKSPQPEKPSYQYQNNQLAIIIYTSGTTGHPKGVVLSHKNLIANVEAVQQYLSITQKDKIMCVLPFYYSYGNSVLHTHISCGATLVLENSFMYPHKVVERMKEERITAFAGVPSTYYLLLARTKLNEYNLSALRYCTQAGGAMDKHRIQMFTEQLPNVDFIVMYGQTEASARLSYLPASKLSDKLGSVGVPIPGVELSIRDEDGNKVESGVQGEVCARGDVVMQGYWKDDAETLKVKKKGWLYTGDLGFIDRDGYLYLVGRNKEMIKTGAHRISPLEIEELISQVPGVTEVAVVGIDDEIMGQVIKACIVADEESGTLLKSVQRLCREKFPLYKVPKEVVFFPELPRTASGKIKKYLL